MPIGNWWDSTGRNLRLAVRTLARTPLFAATVVLTLALGIGTSSAVFSALDAVVLQAVPLLETHGGDEWLRAARVSLREAHHPVAVRKG